MDRERENSNRDTENRGMAGEDEEMKMELELDAAHALANLAGSDPIPNQASISQVILDFFYLCVQREIECMCIIILTSTLVQ